jgi:hypothetical protein
MVQIIRVYQNDDKDASMNISVMVCSSIEKAKETILDIINMDFDGNWGSLTDAASELNCDLEACEWDEKSFRWFDNGQGDAYIIGSVNEKEMDNEFQDFGTI